MKFPISNFQFSKLLRIVVLGILLFPLVSLAGEYKVNDYTVTYEGLVPCGKCVNISPPVKADKTTASQCGVPEGSFAKVIYFSCQLCHLFVMFDEIFDFVLFNIIFPIAALLLVIGGFMFLFYAEDPKRVDQGKSILTSVVIGLVIIFATWLIINTFFMAIGVADWTGLREGWFQINCPIGGLGPVSGPVCGDGNCDPGETFENCPADCPRPPPGVCASGNCGDCLEKNPCENAGCKWCPECFSRFVNSWGVDKCVDSGVDCGWHCDYDEMTETGKCGAECDSDGDCTFEKGGFHCIGCDCQAAPRW